MQLVWFKRDLRVEDHEPLHRAADRGPVIPLYIVEPGLWQQPDMAGRHWAFVRESLLELRASLAQLGQPLVVRLGDAPALLALLCRKHEVSDIWSHQETGNQWTYRRDQQVAETLRALGVNWHECRQHGVVRGRCDRDQWSRQFEELMRRPRFVPRALPAIPGLDPGEVPEWPDRALAADPCPGRQKGGRLAAERILDSFLHRRGGRYHREMSSPLTATRSCSRLSPHLAWGTLAMREALQATRLRRAQLQHPSGSAESWGRALSAFEGRLHWHCHFIQKLESEPRIEFENLQRATADLRGQDCDPVRLQAWAIGRTGWPLVDACMRALHHDGWINFRMRAMLISVASYQLWLPWREPALHLARQFVDYEPGIHYPQVQMQSGTTGINTLRIYNPVKQSLEQDSEGAFIRTWVPELGRVSDAWIHAPWQMPTRAQRACGTRIGEHYPAPLVDHEAAARRARAAIIRARRKPGASQEGRRILQRHGSRKRRAAPARKDPRQGELFGDDA